MEKALYASLVLTISTSVAFHGLPRSSFSTSDVFDWKA